jgi:hypothetical protein
MSELIDGEQVSGPTGGERENWKGFHGVFEPNRVLSVYNKEEVLLLLVFRS